MLAVLAGCWVLGSTGCVAGRDTPTEVGDSSGGETSLGSASVGSGSSVGPSGTDESSGGGSGSTEESSTGEGPPPIVECNDGIDNDGDGLVDWQLDLGCVSQGDLSEGGIPTMELDDGWTVFEASDDTRIVYVSQSLGDDAWDGSAPQPGVAGVGPVRSLAAGMSMIRSTSADWLLLRRGDVWEEGFGTWTASGRSPDELTVIASYGDSTLAPVIHGDLFLAGEEGTTGGPDNVAITHLRFETAGVSSLSGNNILVEGCHFARGPGGVVVEGADFKQDWSIRRNTLDQTSSNAIYINGVTGVLLEGNVIYRPAQDEANHAMYITRRGNSGVEVRDNLIFMGKSTGNAIMMRPGGIAAGNVVVDFGWSGVSVGACDDGDGGPCFDPVDAVVTGNVFLEGHASIGTAIALSDGFVLPGAVITDNIVAASSGEAFNALSMVSGVDGLILEDNIFYNATSVGVFGANRDMQWRNNVWKNNQHDLPLVSIFNAQSAEGLVAEGNTFFASARAPDRWFALPTGDGGVADWQAFSGEVAVARDPRWLDETRSLPSYSEAMGADAHSEAFFLEALGQRKFGYRSELGAPAVVAYLREGYRAP